jgi:hypothetical protein
LIPLIRVFLEKIGGNAMFFFVQSYKIFRYPPNVFAKICHFNFVSEKYRLEIAKNMNNE